MSDKGGLPAIHPYEISRHWYLHELRRFRAFKRVHGKDNGLTPWIKAAQRELCRVRREYYVK